MNSAIAEAMMHDVSVPRAEAIAYVGQSLDTLDAPLQRRVIASLAARCVRESVWRLPSRSLSLVRKTITVPIALARCILTVGTADQCGVGLVGSTVALGTGIVELVVTPAQFVYALVALARAGSNTRASLRMLSRLARANVWFDGMGYLLASKKDEKKIIEATHKDIDITSPTAAQYQTTMEAVQASKREREQKEMAEVRAQCAEMIEKLESVRAKMDR